MAFSPVGYIICVFGGSALSIWHLWSPQIRMKMRKSKGKSESESEDKTKTPNAYKS